MKKYSKYIAIIVAFFATMACTIGDIDVDNNIVVGGVQGDYIQVYGRPISYKDYNIGTRSLKLDEERNIVCMALAIFRDGKCFYYDYQ